MSDAVHWLLGSLTDLPPAPDAPAEPDAPPESEPPGRAPHSPSLGGPPGLFSGDEPALGIERLLAEALRGLESPIARQQAVRTLARLGDAAVPALLERIHDDDREVRRSAAWTLARLRDRRGAANLDRAAGWTYPYTQAPLDAAGLEKLLDALAHGSRASRMAAAAALGRLREARALPDLLEALNDDYALARVAAIRALGQIGDPAAAPHLQDPLDDPDPLIRRAAAAALEALAGPPGDT